MKGHIACTEHYRNAITNLVGRCEENIALETTNHRWEVTEMAVKVVGFMLMLNYDKTYFLQFLTKTNNELNTQVSFGNRKITTVESLKFLGLTIDTTLTWKHHIGEHLD